MKRIILQVLALLTLSLIPATALVGTAHADCGTASTSKGQVLQGIGESGDDCNDGGVLKAVTAVVTILSIVVGAIAVIMIIVSGFRYITSGGDSGKLGTAKNTLIYALVGLAVAVLAQLLVNIVITQADKVANPPTKTESKKKD
ncbi:MAG: pilin [Patescibacteria group bacterium]